MFRKSIVMMVLVLGVVALTAVAWASTAGPDWHAGPGPMMGSDEPGPGAWDEGDWAGMAQWMQRMHGTGPGAEGEGDWAGMAQWMEQMHGTGSGAWDEESWQGMAEWMERVYQEGPRLCPHWGYAAQGADDTPAG